MTETKKDVLQAVDEGARRLGKGLLRSARFAALGTIDPADGSPFVSRVSLATLMDGTPGFLISRLSSHFTNLEADSRCSLLVGEPGKGDPLAHARMTVIARARKLEHGAERAALARRYLLRHPKAALYAEFADFAFWVADIDRASLNGGFGKAFAMTRADLVTAGQVVTDLMEVEEGAVEHMNEDHKEALATYAHQSGAEGSGWRMTGLDPDGVDLVKGDSTARLWFDSPLKSGRDLRAVLAAHARPAAKG